MTRSKYDGRPTGKEHRMALNYLGEITGEVTNDEILRTFLVSSALGSNSIAKALRC